MLEGWCADVEGYLTTKEAAAALGVTLRAIQDRIKAGTLRAERVGARGWVIPQSEVDRFRGMGKLTPGPKPRRTSEADRA